MRKPMSPRQTYDDKVFNRGTGKAIQADLIMKKQGILLIVAFACIVLFTLIAQQRNNVSVQMGPVNLVSLPGKPVRIVSLAPNITEILFALSLDEKIVAVSSDSDYPPQAAAKIKTGTFWQPNIEAIITSKPDLIIVEQIERQKATAETLRKLGYPVLSLKIEKIPELFAAIKEIGKATGCDQQAEQLIASMSLRLNELKSKSGSVDKTKVLWVVQLEPLRVVGRNTFVNDLIEIAGGENAIGDTIQYYPPVGTEELFACGAETIIHSAMDGSDLAQQQKTVENFWSKFTNLPAVKNKRIYVIKADAVLRLGPRLPEGIETITGLLHPQIGPQKQQEGN
jgi:iron complex transport system substrate-binding protein